jgi:hypothetical protein
MRHKVNNLLHGALGRRGGDALTTLFVDANCECREACSGQSNILLDLHGRLKARTAVINLLAIV